MRRLGGALTVVAVGLALGGCADVGNYHGFTASPAEPQTGQTVTFDGRFKNDAGAHTVPPDTKVAWDLDGDGRFETETGTGDGALTASRSYSEPGTYTVGLDLGFSGADDPLAGMLFAGIGLQLFIHTSDTRQVTVTAPPAPPGQNAPPIASFKHNADPGYTKLATKFDATESTDADGRIVTYEWDFGDKGSSDNTAKTTNPGITHQYTAAGNYTVRLRVTDDHGATADAQRMIQVVEGAPQSGVSSASVTTAARRGIPFAMTMVPTKMVDEGTLSMAGDAMVRGNAVVRGKLELARRLAAPLDRTRSPTWTAGFMIRQRGHGRAMRMIVDGELLIDFGHGARTCLGARSDGGAGIGATGYMTVLGGTGAAARMRGAGTFSSRLTPTGPRVTGRLLFASTRRSHPMPETCRSLLRRR
jgi:PKD repeat protein